MPEVIIRMPKQQTELGMPFLLLQAVAAVVAVIATGRVFNAVHPVWRQGVDRCYDLLRRVSTRWCHHYLLQAARALLTVPDVLP